MKHVICTLICLAALALVPAARADTYTPYTLSGTLIWQGNNACGGQCVESVSYSIPLVADQNVYNVYLVQQGQSTVSVSGPLGTATALYSPHHYAAIDWRGAQPQAYTELDVYISFDTDCYGCTQSLGPYIDTVDVWSCWNACVADFCPPDNGQLSCPVTTADIFPFHGTSYATLDRLVRTPEPASFALLAGGLLLLAGLPLFARKRPAMTG